MYIAAKYIYNKTRTDTSSKSRAHEPKSCQHRQSITETDASPYTVGLAPAEEQNILPILPTEKCSQCKKHQHRTRVYRWKLICGLALPYILSTLDLTIVATAVPTIASHFNKFDQLNWIITSFTLTSTAFIPLFGQLADVFGRHAVLQLAMLLMLVGSTLAAAAQSWGMLLLGRALQGTSSAGIMNIIMIVLADRVSLKENARNNSIFVFVGGLGYGIGPVVGGTDGNQSNWRYCFLVPIPIAFISHILIFVLLRGELVEGTVFKKDARSSTIVPALATLDIFGTLLFIFGVGLVILGTAWGGPTYPWSSPQVLAPLIVGGICFVLFFVYEYLLEPGRLFARIFPKQVPMLPYSMFARRDTIWLAISEFSSGAAMFSVFYFIGIYFTLVEAYPASQAGVNLLYYIPGLGVGVYMAVFFCNVYPAQTFFTINFGALTETIGFALLIWAISTQNTRLINGMMVVAGAGTGLRLMPINLHTAGVWPEKIAPVMSLMRFALPFGGTVGLTIMGSVFNNRFSGSGTGSTSGTRVDAHDRASLDLIALLPDSEQVAIRAAGKEGVMWAFIAIMPIVGLSLAAGLIMGNVWIKPKPRQGQGESVDGGGHSEVLYVPYLWALMKGNIKSHKHVNKPSFIDETELRPVTTTT
ncbi:putative MFS multidrug transporter [Aspergillus clavatus NRRL 1]|uniref:MFS multidrug transporter, putative n=1 Tax=Aspergillus clavatus (strain ATCC 1007 / CBS 513.65 / DSM 816 / NCTC 3887 / NRRL 1 / QM 1276 / 107) TaxID=344612 RepID=A1CRG2_ASPCL|nr:MFS multidrug transporter, putative [Aspergillus clavatus NRRL 1]EAW08233.1 MFS multidrug transporter, putative [Aspergillus clavatus NRRL 1]